MKNQSKRMLVLSIVLVAACLTAMPGSATAQSPIPVITYYSGPTTAYYAPTTAFYAPAPAYYAPTTAYYAPTTAYYAPAPTVVYRPSVVYPTTTYYAPAPSVYVPPQPTVVYRRGPLGLVNWPTVAYTPGVIVR